MPQICGVDGKFEVVIVARAEDLPAEKQQPSVCGREATGQRLAFDLGKSDVKVTAVKDGGLISSTETEWAMRDAAVKLDKVEAVGGSSCGIISADNEATFCDLFPNVPPDVYKEKALTMFIRLVKSEFGDVPFKCINDGEVTAVAGQMMIGGDGGG